ncbi:YfiR family protein [Rhodocytophaga rosea]|uniref:YfiR family protein n=1 Tax=Rhodocytophaga rosea TaxID=2704465 RepID=A0A6C0GNJ0_9BACT|nr:YfiR family protein [Rhodocytophaga rosea]QHT69497.1 YfiR family protein [Rhodocytophaga rosea]
MKKAIFYLLLVICSVYQTELYAQNNDYRFHSVFIYNFTKYIQWPASQQSGDFIIAVLGNSPIGTELEKMAENKTVGSQKMIIKRIKSLDEANNCHILFIPSNNSNNFDEIQAKLRGKPTLVITEKTGMAQKGSGINFVMQDNKWKFELNESATQSAGLKVSKELSKLAIHV